MTPLLTDAALAELADREAIRDVIYRYCRAVDRRDRELLAGVYWPGAPDRHGSVSAPAEEIVDIIIASVRAMAQTMHMIGNVLIRIDGASAAVESVFFAYHRLGVDAAAGDAAAVRDVYLGGRYLDRMERRGREWRIADREVMFDWFSQAPGTDWDKGPFGVTFATHASPDDAGYALFAGLSGARD